MKRRPLMRSVLRPEIRWPVLLVAVLAASLYTGPANRERMWEANSDGTAPREGFPDRYAEYMFGIRKADFESRPSYEQNYRLSELANARSAAKSGARSLDWVERGPANVGGRTRAIVVDIRDPSRKTWFAAAVSGGIWKTQNEGESWTHVSQDVPNLAFSSLSQAASRPEVFYAGSGEGFFNGDAISGAGIFKSSDGGLTWNQLPSTATSADFRFVNRLIVSPSDENVVVAATREGIFRSTDGGSSWTAAYRSPALSGILQVLADPQDFNRQYATESGTGVFRSVNGGVTWQEASTGLYGTDDGAIGSDSRIELAIAPSNTQRLYAAVESFNGPERLFTSIDGGSLWVLVPPGPQFSNPDWADTQGWYDSAIAVHPFDEEIVYLGGINMYKATLGGGTTEIGVLTAFEEESTQSFLDFVSFNSATYFDGRLKTGLDEEGAIVLQKDFVSVEIRFGPGRSQKAHRFTPPDEAGIPFSTYPYAGYVDVPFEVWDITNNRQLEVSFRDRLGDGAFNLIERDEQNLGREYIVISGSPYNPSAPDPQIAKTGGPLYKMLYFFWPMLAPGGSWSLFDLPPSTLRIRYETVTGSTRNTISIGGSSSIHVDQHIILPVVTDEDKQLFNLVVGNDGGVFLSRNQGGSWLDRNAGYNTSQFYGVDKKPLENQFIGGTQDNGTWRSPVNPAAQASWIRALGGDGFETLWNQESPQELLASIQFNDFRRSVNFGQSWSSAKSGLTDVGDPDDGGGGQFMSTLARSTDLPEVVYTIGKSGVWKSVNFGASWSLRSIAASNWGFGGSGKVRVSEADGRFVWAGYEMGVALTGPEDVLGKMHVSTDRGETFSPVPTPTQLASGRISGLATHPNDPQTAFVLFSASGRPKIIRTTDLGQSWEDLTGFAGSSSSTSTNGFPNVAVFDLLVIPQKPSELWAGTEIGLFTSRDNGATWTIADNGLPAVAIWQMRIVDDQVVMATHGRGIWTVDLAEAIAADTAEPEPLPSSFSLDQNYPNPFNPSTTIRYSLSVGQDVQMSVYDAVGRKVDVLVDGYVTRGSHEVVWDAGSRASGTYIVRMSAGSEERSRLMTLIR